MRSLQDEIRQAQQELACPVCGRSFGLNDIQLRSVGEKKVFELSVTCNRGHFPVILLVPVALQETINAGPITQKELKSIHHEIESLTTLERVFR